MEYVIEVATSGSTRQVYRRYNDFKRLHEALSQHFNFSQPHHSETLGVLPHLPSQSGLTRDRTNSSHGLIAKRQKFLEIYLQQLLVPGNRLYGLCEELKKFLTEDETVVGYKAKGRPILGLTSRCSSDIDTRPIDPNAEELKRPPAAPAASGSTSAAAQAASNIPAVVGLGVPLPQIEVPYTRACIRVPADDDREASELFQMIGLPADQGISAVSPSVPDFYREHGGSDAAAAGDLLGRPTSGSANASKTLTSSREDLRRRVLSASHVSDLTVPFETCLECGCVTKVTFPLLEWIPDGYCGQCGGYRIFSLTIPTLAAVLMQQAHGAPPNGTSIGVGQPPSSVATIERRDTSPDAVSPAAASPLAAVPLSSSPSAPDHATASRPRTSPLPLAAPLVANVAIVRQASLTAATPSLSLGSSAPSAGPSMVGPLPQGPAPRHTPISPTNLDEFAFLTTLGRGTFGKVIKVRHIPSRQIFAMKILSKSNIVQKHMEGFLREERRIWQLVSGPTSHPTMPSHPYVCQLHAAFQTASHLFFIMDYLPGGELYTHLLQLGTFSEEESRFYIAELILALQHIHSRNVCHRDLKPENLTLDADGHAKLIDFGLAAADLHTKPNKQFVGSAEYIAPEIIKVEKQTFAVDWWCVGCILFEMLSGHTPFYAPTAPEIYRNVLTKQVDFSHPPVSKPQLWQDESLVDLLRSLLDRDPKRRLAYATSNHGMLANKWLNHNLDLKKLRQRQLLAPFRPDLKLNDTKYVNVESVSEWATLPAAGPIPGGSREQDRVKIALIDFAEIHPGRGTGRGGAPEPPPALANLVPGVDALTQQQMVAPNAFVGVWRLRRVALIAANGMVALPWGSQVVGLLIYTSNSLFSMQLCPLKRPQYRDRTRAARDEILLAFSTYVASFGTVDFMPRQSIVIHRPVAAVCPSLTHVVQRRVFHVTQESLVLQTLQPEDAGDGIMAVVSTEWERVA